MSIHILLLISCSSMYNVSPKKILPSDFVFVHVNNGHEHEKNTWYVTYVPVKSCHSLIRWDRILFSSLFIGKLVLFALVPKTEDRTPIFKPIEIGVNASWCPWFYCRATNNQCPFLSKPFRLSLRQPLRSNRIIAIPRRLMWTDDSIRPIYMTDIEIFGPQSLHLVTSVSYMSFILVTTCMSDKSPNILLSRIVIWEDSTPYFVTQMR